MKPILSLLGLACLLSSCTQYQYLTVSGVDIAKSDTSGFSSENDTLKVQYHFSDYKGKLGISIHNKSGQPLEIDWRKSAIILDGKAISFFNPNATIAATIEQDSTRWRNLLAGFRDPIYLASLNGSILINEPTQFIPPTSFIYKVPLALPLHPFENLPEQSVTKEKVYFTAEAYYTYKKIKFDRNASPLAFRSYLTFRIGHSNSQREFTVEHNFYISEIWKTTEGPQSFPAHLIMRGDRFYL